MRKTLVLYFIIGIFIQPQLAFGNGNEMVYKSFVIGKEKVFILKEDGSLKIYKKENGEEINFPKKISQKSINCIELDNKNKLIIGFTTGEIVRIQDDLKIDELYKYNSEPEKIFITKSNEVFVLMSNGIHDIEAKKEYILPKKLRKRTLYYLNEDRYFNNLNCGLIDSKGKIWIGFDDGEWGGDIKVFDTNKKKYYQPKFKSEGNKYSYFNPIRSIFEDNHGNVFMTTSLMHMGIIQSHIYKFSGLIGKIIYAKERGDNGQKNKMQYLGPGNIYDGNNEMFIYSELGFYKSKLDSIDFKFEFNPKIKWINGMPKAVGYSMNVIQIEFDKSNKMYFLTKFEGLAIRETNEIIYLK